MLLGYLQNLHTGCCCLCCVAQLTLWGWPSICSSTPANAFPRVWRLHVSSFLFLTPLHREPHERIYLHLWRAKVVTQRSLSIFLLKMITDNISILMYIMWVILHLFSALSRRVGALQVSTIIMAEYSPHITMQCTTMFEHGHGVLPDVNALWYSPSQGVARRPQTIKPSLHASASELMSLTTMLWNQNWLLGWPSNIVNYCAHKHSQVSYMEPKSYLDSMW